MNIIVGWVLWHNESEEWRIDRSHEDWYILHLGRVEIIFYRTRRLG